MMSSEVAILAKRKRQRRTICDEDDALVTRGDDDKNKESFVIFQFLNFMVLEGYSFFGNVHRNRQQTVDWSNDLIDTMFNRQFRICREDLFQKDEIKAKK
jgi:hypothetical protein